MKSKLRMIRTTVRGLAVAAAAALSFGACGLNDEAIPELSGPSTTGIQIRLEALPDVITADGFSTSLIRITVYDQNGTPASGRTVILALANSAGQFADIGTLYSPTGSLLRAAEATVVTGSNGQATAVYTAPPRTDFTADGSIQVRARAVGTDANGDIYNFVRIELKSAEPRLFAGQVECGFVVEAPVGQVNCTGPTTCTVKAGASVLFQSTSAAVRYAWFWGDGSPPGDKPNENHVFRVVGAFTVTHIVTDEFGGQSACQASIMVE
jgi:PKD domain